MIPWVPPIEWGQHLVDLLWEFGPVKKEWPLEDVNILAIQQVLGVQFQPWESRLLLRLSREYYGEMNAATKRDAPPPWPDAAPQWQQVRNAVSARNLAAFLR